MEILIPSSYIHTKHSKLLGIEIDSCKLSAIVGKNLENLSNTRKKGKNTQLPIDTELINNGKNGMKIVCHHQSNRKKNHHYTIL